jgi:hypothetical protein
MVPVFSTSIRYDDRNRHNSIRLAPTYLMFILLLTDTVDIANAKKVRRKRIALQNVCCLDFRHYRSKAHSEWKWLLCVVFARVLTIQGHSPKPFVPISFHVDPAKNTSKNNITPPPPPYLFGTINKSTSLQGYKSRATIFSSQYEISTWKKLTRKKLCMCHEGFLFLPCNN